VKNDILQTLTGDEQFMASANEREQCFHACRILRIARILGVPYSVIGHLLSRQRSGMAPVQMGGCASTRSRSEWTITAAITPTKRSTFRGHLDDLHQSNSLDARRC
jgi:hypothetical protein